MADRVYKIDGKNPINGEPVTEYPSVTTVCDLMDKPFLRQWAADCVVKYLHKIVFGTPKIGAYFNDGVHMTSDMFTQASTEYIRQGQEAALFGTKVHAIAERYFSQFLSYPKMAHLEDDPKVIYTTEQKQDGSTVYTDHELIWDDLFRKLYKGLHDWYKKNNIVPISMEEVLYGDGYAGRYDLVCTLNGTVTMIDVKTGKGSYYEAWKPQLAAYRRAYEKVSRDTGNWILAHGFLKWNKATEKWNYKAFTDEYEIDYAMFTNLKNLWWNKQIKKQLQDVERARKWIK